MVWIERCHTGAMVLRVNVRQFAFRQNQVIRSTELQGHFIAGCVLVMVSMFVIMRAARS
jgi:hypothetical protein